VRPTTGPRIACSLVDQPPTRSLAAFASRRRFPIGRLDEPAAHGPNRRRCFGGHFRIVHIGIQRTPFSCSSGLTTRRHSQGFQVSAAKHLHAAVSITWSVPRRGKGFARRARHVLAYVLTAGASIARTRPGSRGAGGSTPSRARSRSPDPTGLEDSSVLFAGIASSHSLARERRPRRAFRDASQLSRRGMHPNLSGRSLRQFQCRAGARGTARCVQPDASRERADLI
jgi:hypothetical protein